jgi:hypothetical protein
MESLIKNLSIFNEGHQRESKSVEIDLSGTISIQNSALNSSSLKKEGHLSKR